MDVDDEIRLKLKLFLELFRLLPEEQKEQLIKVVTDDVKKKYERLLK